MIGISQLCMPTMKPLRPQHDQDEMFIQLTVWRGLKFRTMGVGEIPQRLRALALFTLFYVSECFAWTYVCTMCLVPQEVRRRHHDPLELELWRVVSHPVGARANTRSFVRGAVNC